MSYRMPQTLVRAGRYDKSLDEAVRGFSEHLEPIAAGLGNTVKYATFKEAKEPYLLMVSQQIDKLVTPPGYNILLTVTSYSRFKNLYIANQFERETGIHLGIEVPDKITKQFALIGVSFKAFEKNPRLVMAVLREMPYI